MNKEIHNEQLLHELNTGVAGKHIRSEISKHPKMSDRVAALVARNLDALLEQLKEKGVAMHEICRAARLGNPDDRDSKALFKYRNPEGSKSRDYISQAQKYVKLAEAIADMKDHPYSGSSSELLRRVFSGTTYAPALTTSSDGAVALKGIMDEVTNWIAREINLVQAYERIQSSSIANLSNSTQFALATDKLLNRPWRGCHLELGFQDTTITDDQGQPLVLKSEGSGSFDLCIREDISLFIGIDADGLPRPYLAFEKSLVAKSKDPLGREDVPSLALFYISYIHDGPHEGQKFGELIFDAGRKRFYLPKDIVARTVDLEKLGLHLQDVPYGNSYEQENPVYMTFMGENPKYASNPFWGGSDLSGRVFQTLPVTADTLEHLELVLRRPGGKFFPAGTGSRVFLVPNSNYSGKHTLFGDGVLPQVIKWFTGENHVMYKTDPREEKFLGNDIQNSQIAPKDGWISVSPGVFEDSYYWSPADLLWLRCKMFAVGAETQVVNATKKQRARYEELLQRLQHSG